MALILRSAKGSPLTHEEGDGNWQHLEDRVDTVEANTQSALDSATAAEQSAIAAAASANSIVATDQIHNLVTAAERESIIQTNRNVHDRSGFVELGKHSSSTEYVVNNGLSALSLAWTAPNSFWLGGDAFVTGDSKTKYPVINVNGSVLAIDGLPDNGSSSSGAVQLPPAPTVTHADATNSGLIKNGDGSLGDNGDWTVSQPTTTTIGGGKLCSMVATTSNQFAISQPVSYVAGDVIEIELSLENVTSGSVAFNFTGTGTVDGATLTTNGTYKEVYTCDGSETAFGIWVLSTFTGAIGFSAIIRKADVNRTDAAHIRVKPPVDISTRGNQVFPYNNSQYRGADLAGLTGIADASFIGADTYSLMYEGQAAGSLTGKVYDWDLLDDAQRAIFAGDVNNDIFKDGDVIKQGSEYKAETFAGSRDYESYHDFATEQGYTLDPNDDGLYWDGEDMIIPIGVIKRYNQGAFHPTFNERGTTAVWDGGAGTGDKWYQPVGIANLISTLSCFDYAVSFNQTGKAMVQDGYDGSIGSNSQSHGRADGKFYDAIYADDITDYRLSTDASIDENKTLQHLASGNARGSEGEWVTESFTQHTPNASINGIYVNNPTDYNLGDVITVSHNGVHFRDIVTEIGSTYIRTNTFYNRVNGVEAYTCKQSTAKSSGTMMHCDIIGDPVNYPTAWTDALANGYDILGIPLLVGEEGQDYIPDGTSKTVKLSKPYIDIVLQLYSDDNGVTWDAGLVGFDPVTNAYSSPKSDPVGRLRMYFYTTPTNTLQPDVNTAVESIGDVYATCADGLNEGNSVLYSLVGKVGVSGNASNAYKNIALEGYALDSNSELSTNAPRAPIHSTIGIAASNPAVKCFPYKSDDNVHLVFEELKHNATSWGDHLNDFEIVDNVETKTDDNGETVLQGQKSWKLKSDLRGAN